MIIRNTNGHHIYMKQKEGERGQDTRERECEREGEWPQDEVASVVKMTILMIGIDFQDYK